MAKDLTLSSDEGQSLRLALHNLSDEQWQNFETRIGLRLSKTFQIGPADSRKIAGDIVAKAVQQALEAAPRFDPQKGDIMGWLWGIAVNEIRHLKRDGYYTGDLYRDKQFIVPKDNEAQTSSSEPLEDIFVKAGVFSLSPEQQSELVMNEIIAQTLTAEEQELLNFYRIGYDANEVATYYGISAGTVYTRLSRLRQKLRAAYSKTEQI